MSAQYARYRLADQPQFIQKIIEQVLEREGGEYTDHKHDWPTKWGIRQLTADRVGWKGNLPDLDRDTAASIWFYLWYVEPKIYLIAEHSQQIADSVIDTGGPAGIKVGVQHLQRALNSFNMYKETGNRDAGFIYGPDLNVDGNIGPMTAAMLQRYLSHRGEIGEQVLYVRHNALQDVHYILTAERNKKKRSFSFGWTRGRVLADMLRLTPRGSVRPRRETLQHMA